MAGGSELLITIVIICALARGFCGYLEQYYGHDVAFRLLAMIRSRIFNALRKLAPARMLDKRSGDLVSTIMADVEYIEVFFAHTIAPVTIGIVVPAAVLVFLGSYWPGFILIVLPFYLALGLGIPLLTNHLAREKGRSYRKELSFMHGHLVESLQGLRELLLFNKGRDRLEQIRAGSRRLDRALGQLRNHEGFIFALSDSLIIAAIGAVLLAASIRYTEGLLSLPGLIVVVAVTSSSFGPVIALSSLSGTLMQTFAAAERIFRLMDEKPAVDEEREDTAANKPRQMTPIPAPVIGELAYHDVCFHYPSQHEDVLRLFSLVIRQGEHVALVGKSGSGKSTALRLLLRFWDPSRGAITWNGRNINTVLPAKLRAGMAVVSQDTFLFSGSIADNIKIGNPQAPDEAVEKAAQRASVDQFIKSLPQGYQTPVGELGDKLSGGERQRLALARALLIDAPLLLLDEPTSNLDVLNEKKVLKALAEACKGKTVLMVSHRPSTVAAADQIFVLEKGRIVERGKHGVLLQAAGTYSNLMSVTR